MWAVARRKQRTPELRSHLLVTAIDLLVDQGIDGFTTRRLAELGGTSAPAVYELFGDRAGVVRAVFFEGFRLLGLEYALIEPTGDARTDLVALMRSFKAFNRDNPVLAEVMFSRPFSDFNPGIDELEAAASVRGRIADLVAAAIEAGELRGDPTDLTLALVATAEGLAAAERGGRLGTRSRDTDRRWEVAFDAILFGGSAR